MNPARALRTLAFLAGMTAAVLSLTAAHAQTSPLPVEQFFKNVAVRSPLLSPQGKKIAMLVPNSSGRISLAVADISAPTKFVGIAQFDDADIGSFHWVSEDRLVFTAVDFRAALGDQLGSGLYAINADGSEFRWLIERNGNYKASIQTSKRPLRNYYQFLVPLFDGSNDVLVKRWEYQGGSHAVEAELMRLNTFTQATKRLYLGAIPDGVSSWLLDRDLQPRVAIAQDTGTGSITYWRDADTNQWQEIDRGDIFDSHSNAIHPVAIDKNGQLYVSAQNKQDPDHVTALYRYNIKEKQVEQPPIISLPGFDFEGSFSFDPSTKELLAINYAMDAPATTLVNKTLKESQENIDKLLPYTINSITCAPSNCLQSPHFIVTATSDIQSPIYFLYERNNNKLSLLGATRPWLDSRQMAGTQDFVRIKARDGKVIPVYITKPKGKGPWPTVVMIHGGPYVRGSVWAFHPQNQFLASRGYLVVEPEFRGSTGYGLAHTRAGWKQWGLAMQDDVTDATRWAITQGMADPKRIAIAGASYGGYATMMGLLKEPELYKAGVNWVGVTDIELMYDIGWSDFLSANNPWARYGMPLMIGDPVKDREQLRATSPLRHAARIKQPVLLAYGEEDYRVPLPHGKKMRDALIESGNKQVEWIEYAGEGHGWLLEKNNIDFWTRVERFLANHLK